MIEPGIHPGIPDSKTHFFSNTLLFVLEKEVNATFPLWLIAVLHGLDPSWSSDRLSSVPGGLEIFDTYQIFPHLKSFPFPMYLKMPSFSENADYFKWHKFMAGGEWRGGL